MALTIIEGSWPQASDPQRVLRERARWLQGGRSQANVAEREAILEAAAPFFDAIFGNSPYLTGIVHSEPDLPGRLLERPVAALVHEELAAAQALPHTERGQLLKALRRTKRRVALLTAAGDIGGTMPVMATTEALARFADIAVDRVLRFLLKIATDRKELAPSVLDEAQTHGIFVLALGKHGGFELNYSSDIDLIVFYEPSRLPCLGRTTPSAAAVSVTRALAQLLQETGRDGYVFRTDLRLRPYPAGQPLALTVAAAETYYERHGQNWERAAFIKARAIAGDLEVANAFLRRIAPFIWRRSLDFNAISDIQSIKRQINAQYGHSDLRVYGHNIKLGRGGIREIEFFVQTQQLILGGRHADLRDRTTLGTLNALKDGGWIAADTADRLSAAYIGLRRVEHRLQMIDDAQTHIVPKAGADFDRVATFLGYPDAVAAEAAIRDLLETVEEHYAALFETSPDLSDQARLVFAGVDDDAGTLAHLKSLGFADPKALSQRVRQWHHGHIMATRSERSRERLTELMPELIRALSRQPDPDGAFRRFDAFLSAQPAGMQLFAMLRSNPRLFALVATVMGAAPRMAERLAANPRLFDAALMPDPFDISNPREHLARELATTVEAARGFEDLLDRVRVWGQSRQFLVELQVLEARQSTAAVQQALTELAEMVLAVLLPAAHDWLADQHGYVPGGRFAVLAFGKLGSGQLSIGSDLDLVFVYDAASDAVSDGPRPLPASTYYARLGQRLIAAISAKTAEGQLYEIDMRLRPSGNVGPLATNLENFTTYQRRTAQIWEHQALTRARPLLGDASLIAELYAEIDDILRQPREREPLAAAVIDMRKRVFAEHGSNDPWACKQAPGGLVSIDFAAQFLVLQFASEHPTLLHLSTDGIYAEASRLGLIDFAQARTMRRGLALNQALENVLRLTLGANVEPADAPLALQHALLRAAEFATGDDAAGHTLGALEETLRQSQNEVEATVAAIYGVAGAVLDEA